MTNFKHTLRQFIFEFWFEITLILGITILTYLGLTNYAYGLGGLCVSSLLTRL